MHSPQGVPEQREMGGAVVASGSRAVAAGISVPTVALPATGHSLPFLCRFTNSRICNI